MTDAPDGTSILTPFLPRIHAAFTGAWRDLEALAPELRADMTSRTRAAFLHDRILVHIRRQFDGEKGVSFVRGRGGLTLLALQHRFLIRFKKLRRDLRTSNIPTQQSLAFARQQTLPGIPALTHLNAGYVLNRMQTNIESTHITCPNGKQVAWALPMGGNEAAVVEFAPRDTTTETTSRVKGRREGGDRATGEGENK